jgi:hypothetical protein
MGSIPKPMKGAQDCSNWIASITCINGALNGSIGPYCLDMCYDTLKYQERGRENSNWLQDGYIKGTKLIIILQNLGSPYLTKDRIQENIIKVIKIRDREERSQIYQIAMQYNLGLPEQMAEGLDLNRHLNESIPEYLKRVFSS